ncbi:glycosyltransferase family 32 protein [Nibricoccus sp. IMCC34717]|uniref:glycosyltransferase family 32 protein n=1 Tax=Nibricoccus sp. IMCC34717 TaxID=3034021 RepID=UPI00384CE6BE
MIPKLLHQMAKTARTAERWESFMEKAKALHPTWRHRLWTEADCRALLADREPQLLAAYDLISDPLIRVDIARMVILQEYGGLYLDLDYEMLRPFDLLRHRLVLPKARSVRMGDRRDCLGTAVMASEPGHPFWELALKRVREMPPLRLGKNRHRTTGKEFLTQLFENEVRGKALQGTVATPERPLFHPPTPHTDAEYDSICAEGVAYGIHHCHGASGRRRLPAGVRAFLRRLLPEYA